MKLFKVPPRVPDSVNRTHYVPVSVSIPAKPGVDNAVIEFGYAESGDPAAYYCTARQEACVAQNSTINSRTPFYFAATEAGSITGMPCRTGCTITIPAVPGRVVYYRVDARDGSGKVMLQSSGVQVVP